WRCRFPFRHCPTAPDPHAAQQAAITPAGTNKILGQSVSISAGDVSVDTTNRLVKVTVSLTGAGGVKTFFGKALGKSQVSVQTQAAAHASTSAGATRCIKPVYIPNTIFSALTPDQACKAQQVIFDASHTISASASNAK